MKEIGVRELKNRASSIIRSVRQDRAEYVITYRGRPAAHLVPIEQETAGQEAWAELERLSQEVSARWQSDKSAAELLDETRR